MTHSTLPCLSSTPRFCSYHRFTGLTDCRKCSASLDRFDPAGRRLREDGPAAAALLRYLAEPPQRVAALIMTRSAATHNRETPNRARSRSATGAEISTYAVFPGRGSAHRGRPALSNAAPATNCRGSGQWPRERPKRPSVSPFCPSKQIAAASKNKLPLFSGFRFAPRRSAAPPDRQAMLPESRSADIGVCIRTRRE